MPKKTATKKTAVKKPVSKPVKAKKTASGFSVPVFTVLGKPHTDMAIDEVFMKVTAPPSLIAQAVRVYQTNLRHGNASTKTRGEVSGSTRKIYRQKGTGRARHGSNKAPLFVGGGITFGPLPRDFSAHLPLKMQRLVFTALLTQKLHDKNVHLISGFDKIPAKTKNMTALLDELNLQGQKVLLIIDPAMKNAYLASRNIARMSVRHAHTVSLLDLLQHKQLVVADIILQSLFKRNAAAKTAH